MKRKLSLKSPGLIITLISVPIFIGALDLTVVSAVLPHVILDMEIPLQTGLDNAAWIVTGYLLAYSVSMVFMGRLSDLYGRRRIFLIALVIFAFGSYLVAVSDGWPTQFALKLYYLFSDGRPDKSYLSLDVLIASRMIQAFGAGAMVPVGMAMVADLYPAGKRAQILGFIAGVDTAGWVVGHLYGGIITRYWNWRMIFWLNLPICLIAFGLIFYMLKDIKQPSDKGSMDWRGAALITLSLTILNVGLSTGSESSNLSSFQDQTGLPSFAIPAILIAVFLFGLFIWWQRRAKHPLIKLSLFSLPNYFSACISNFLVGISLFIAIANVPLFINTLVAESVDQGAWDSGWMLSALTVPMALASIPGGWATERKGYRWPAVVGIVGTLIGFGLMTGWTAETSYYIMIPHLILTGVGFGLIVAPIAAAVIDASPSEHRGTSSAMVIIFRLVGMTIGVSSITTYGLRRLNTLSEAMLTNTADYEEVLRVSLAAAEKVISETFIIAGVIAAISLVTIFMLKYKIPKEV